MRKEEVGIVVEIDGKIAKVRASRHGDCDNCGACPGDSAMVVDAQNPISAKAGELVAFEIPEANMLQAAFVVYIMPLIAIFIGALLGGIIANRFGQTVNSFRIVGAIVVFVLSVIGIKLYDKFVKSNEKMQPMITKILSK